MTPRTLSIDFETRATVDLKRTGVATYAEHPDTGVICMAWAFDDEPVQVWRRGAPFPADVLVHVQNGGTVQAWNASFEFNIWNKVLLRQIHLASLNGAKLDLAQLSDTMIRAAYYGLPLSLDMAGPAANLTIKKDAEGHKLMMRMCRPRAIDPVTGEITWWDEVDPAKLDALCAYCGQDVEVERAIGRTLPALPEREARLWLEDQKANERGVGVDYPFVEQLKALALDAAARTNLTISALTGGLVPTITSTAKLLAVLQGAGYPHDNLRKATVAERLDSPLCVGFERDLLVLRSEGAKTSAAKLDAMLSASVTRGGVGRVRGMLQHYGAVRTGRWAGRLIQLQNMPRGELADEDEVDRAVAAVIGFTPPSVLELLFGSTLRVVSSLLRACIVAAKDKLLVCADFAQIEARVLPWLADEQKVLAVFRGGGDVYRTAAAGIFGVAPDKVTKAQRQIGKVAVLALGFQGGKGAFQVMAGAYGLTLPDHEAENIKLAWRADNPMIVQLWADLDAAARQVLRNPSGGLVSVAGGKLLLGMWGRHMIIRLPSGRGLVYRDARLEPDEDGRDTITYMGLNQYTRKWERLKTYGGKLAENVTQATARDVMAEVILSMPGAMPDTPLLLTVHDELLAETDVGIADAELEKLLALMRTPPTWAADLPVGAEGFTSLRYKK